MINWWVASQSTQATNGVVFALASSQGDLLEGNSPIKTGEVVGFGVIEITSAPQTLSLINASNAEVFYAVAVPNGTGALAFSNTAGNIAVYPPLNTEVSVSTVFAALISAEKISPKKN